MKKLFIIGLGLTLAVSIVACGDSSSSESDEGTPPVPSIAGAGSPTVPPVKTDGDNSPPVAKAGRDMEAVVGESIDLSGESSIDPDGDALTFRWELTSRPLGSAATLRNADTATPAMEADAVGEYELSLVVNDGSVDSAPASILVTVTPWFTDVTQSAGVAGGGPQEHETGFGAGAAWADYDNDLYVDLYVTRDGPNLLYRNNGDGTFAEMGTVAGVAGSLNSYGATWGDFDNDGDQDLYVVNHGEDQVGDLDHVPDQANNLYRNNGDGTFNDIAAEAGVDHVGHGIGATWVDLYDGLLGLFVWNLGVLGTPAGKDEANLLFRNRGDGTFEEITTDAKIPGGDGELIPSEGSGVGQSGLSFGAIFFDYDNDRNADLFVANENGSASLYRNGGTEALLSTGFEDVTEEAGLLARGRARGAVSGDYDNDGNQDVYVTEQGPNRLWRNNGDGTFTDLAAEAGVADSSAGWGAAFIDFDNDGDSDLYVANGASGPVPGAKQKDKLFRNDGDGSFTDVTDLANIDNQGVGRAVAFADYDDDGDNDIYVVNADGQNVLYRNEVGSRANWLKIGLFGTDSNPQGVGAIVTVTTPDVLVRTVSVSAGSGYLGQNGDELLFGLGTNEQADVSVVWPTGTFQNFWSLRPHDVFVIREAGVEGSCPMIFTWDGSTYTLASDILGSGVTGFLMGPDIYRFPIDTDEYLRIENIEPRNGSYSIKIAELLNEILYLDQVKLLIVDHPAGTDVYPNERLMLVPPFPEPKMYVVTDARPPVSAFDDEGNDILGLLSERDGIYVDDYGLLPYQGYAEEHSIVLDLGDLSEVENIILLMHGWTHYVTSFSNQEAVGNGEAPMLPVLEVIDDSGQWVPVTMNMGFPAGQPKTMVYDLKDQFLTDDYRIRITTNLQILWDQVLVAEYLDDVEPRITELEPSMADVHWRGYPNLLPARGDRGMYPPEYDYNSVDEVLRHNNPEGDYTRYGDVKPLVSTIDDIYVIMESGDEVTVEFDAGRLPALPASWDRTVVLYMDGWMKYVEPFLDITMTVDPLPFHAMSYYPYPPEESYPQDEAHQRYLAEYNTRTVP